MLVVAPLAGAWIETNTAGADARAAGVAPLAGAWIETSLTVNNDLVCSVAPLAGAWIETTNRIRRSTCSASRPSRARGLKLLGGGGKNIMLIRRAPRGRVD